jgi:glycosyltransferase involved in cell wall biosynthesis
VGRFDRRTQDLAQVEGVTMTGHVDDMAGELSRCDVAAVPIRFGSGTRVKILEAFAHRIPVVSTTLGAEGLEAVDGEHLLLADDPTSFARACERLLGDVVLRKRVAEAGADLWDRRYRAEVLRRRVIEVAERSLRWSPRSPRAARRG